MINKFQQGGKQNAVMLFVLGLALTLLADPNLIIQIAQLNPKALEVAVQTYQQTQDMNQAAQAFQLAIQLGVLAARHGVKLQYLKSLKHQCAEDEEVVYFKRGGSVDCECKKKENKEVTKADNGWKAKFKNRNINENDTIHTEKGIRDLSGKTSYPRFNPKEATLKEKDRASEKDYNRGYSDHTRPGIKMVKSPKHKNGGKAEKDCGGSKMKLQKKGGEVCPKCGKVHAAGMGCAVAKFKMHRLGGSLNGIPFIKLELV